MSAQDIGPTWGDWADAAFVIESDAKSLVISRTDYKDPQLASTYAMPGPSLGYCRHIHREDLAGAIDADMPATIARQPDAAVAVQDEG